MINGGFKMSKQDLELMAHLLRRAGFGATREELEVCIDKGYEETVEELLNPTSSESMPDDIIHRYHVDIHESRYGPSAASNWLYRLITTTSPLSGLIANCILLPPVATPISRIIFID